MDLNTIVNAVTKMFPSVNLPGAVKKAQQALNGTPDSLEGAAAAAKKLGLDPQAVNEIYKRYGNTMQAKAICRMMGTTPEALKADADQILGSASSQRAPARGISSPGLPGKSKRFPRLK